MRQAGEVPRVADDEQVQQTSDDQECVAVFVGDGDHGAGAEAECARDDVGQPDADVRNRGQRDQRLTGLEGKQPALQRQADGEHQRQRKHENDAFDALSGPHMTRARDEPGGQRDEHRIHA